MVLSQARAAVSALRNGANAVATRKQLTAALLTISFAVSVSPSSTAQNESKSDNVTKLEIYFMDRIAKKSYLNNPTLTRTTDPRYLNRATGDDTSDSASVSTTRPRGVPTRLRLLTIDVPQCKDAFRDGICRQPSKIFEGAADPLFIDGVARSKRMDQAASMESQTRKERRESKRPIEQKSLAKMLYYCYGLSNVKEEVRGQEIDPVIGVEILEASIMNLNPNNIRRTYTSKSMYKYDPGKYSDKKQNEDDGIADVDETTSEDPEEAATVPKNTTIHGKQEDTRTAPWNQYAWLEEIHLRIHGLVPFNAPMQRSSLISHNIFGRTYQQTVPSSMPIILRLFPWTFWGNNIRRVEGADGEGECKLCDDSVSTFKTEKPQPSRRLNRASNKPHAVIADGVAMQRVPGSLRFLTKVCRDARVPLYILNDPRSWGRLSTGSYSSLDEVLVDLRKTVTDNVVSGALELREGNAFERGRLVGRFEKEIEWQARDAGRKTRETWRDAKQRWRRERLEDWSELDEDALKNKLTEKKVLTGDSECSVGLRNLCRGCATTDEDEQTHGK